MKALVVGSAHLDVLAMVTGDDLAVNKIGRVSIDVGGTGANIAVNLRKLGAQVTMLTAMNNSPFSRIVQEFMVSHGLNLPRLKTEDSGSCYAAACAAVSRTQFRAGSCSPPAGASRTSGQHIPYQSRTFIAALASACALYPHRVQT